MSPPIHGKQVTDLFKGRLERKMAPIVQQLLLPDLSAIKWHMVLIKAAKDRNLESMSSAIKCTQSNP